MSLNNSELGGIIMEISKYSDYVIVHSYLRAHCLPEFQFILHLNASSQSLTSHPGYVLSFSEPCESSGVCSLHSSCHHLPHPTEAGSPCAQLSVQQPNLRPCKSLELFLYDPSPASSGSLLHRFQLPELPLTPASVTLTQPVPCRIPALHTGQENASRQKSKAAILRHHTVLFCNVRK